MSSLLVRYVLDTIGQPRHYWLTIEQLSDQIIVKIMLIKDVSLEQQAPLGFNHKNHPTKFKITFTRGDDNIHKASLDKGSWVKVLYALCVRCSVEIWERRLIKDYCGLETTGVDDTSFRTEWFPATEECKTPGDLENILRATEVVKVI